MKRKKKFKSVTLGKPIKLRFSPFGKACKVYNDGNHFVAVPSFIGNNNNVGGRKKTDEEKFFDEMYSCLLLENIKPKNMFCPLKDAILEKYPNMEDIDDFVEKNIKRQSHNYFSRIKRLKRKANLNIWNKWVTITYDPKKHTELTFRKKLRKCLSNLHSRRGWNYMGVFELAPETNRLHFHALMYIEDNQMIGKIEEKQDYSTAQHKMQVTHSNSFFADAFGRNDFEELTEADIKSGRTLEYLTKYISKTGEKIIYSRGIPSELSLFVDNQDIATEYYDYGVKFVLFDNCINKYGVYTPYEPKHYGGQCSLFDYEELRCS